MTDLLPARALRRPPFAEMPCGVVTVAHDKRRRVTLHGEGGLLGPARAEPGEAFELSDGRPTEAVAIDLASMRHGGLEARSFRS